METLTSFGPAGAVVAVVWLFFKYLVPAIDKLSESNEALTKKIDNSHKTDKELLEFMRNLNGELKKATQKKLDP